ncbi:type IIL restriction-modification enzyme MmeI [Pelagimonas varians]|uniref:type IIL restriction-modification enzyme MmeI n=1 Tax=Pelagimonas varians TaxID=696760 RepID=UPI000BEF1034|nr:type IIL restriction-modification enzyme MmeI [Pelagimonas varians]PYG24692.1 hypothetical protein C8N36_1483 [Pelagimonas varians]
MTDLKRFNGGLFKEAEALNFDNLQLGLLIEAPEADWKQVELAIFGTLLERALDKKQRHKLGAHYAPRTYVERLVTPTIMQLLRKRLPRCASRDPMPGGGRQTKRGAEAGSKLSPPVLRNHRT